MIEKKGIRIVKKKGLIMAFALCLCIFGGVQQVAEAATQSPQVTESRVLMAPSGIVKDSSGRMYMADRSYHVLRRRNENGNFVVLAGKEGESGYRDGSAKNALFNSPWDTAAYQKGWAISDTENHVIRYYNGTKVTTLAGAGKIGYKNATGKKAAFNRPTGLAVGKNGELYIADTGNNIIRVMDQKGKVTVYAGSKKGCADGKLKNARFCEPTGLCYYKGVLYVADSGNHRICKIENGKVTTMAGSSKGIEGDAVGSAAKARFSNPQEILLYKDVMYISDTGNGSVKKLSKGKVSTVVEAFSMDDQKDPAEPCGLAIKGSYLYVGDLFVENLLKIKI